MLTFASEDWKESAWNEKKNSKYFEYFIYFICNINEKDF